MAVTHILFDFFGTLVEYSASQVDQGYARSYALLRDAGAQLDYEGCLGSWAATFADFERAHQSSLDEYSMDEVTAEILSRILDRTPDAALIERWRDSYLREWSGAVRPIAGVQAMLAELASEHTLVLVTNTHYAPLVVGQLESLGIAGCFAEVVTSVEHGKRKPSPCIFQRALDATGGAPERAIYVGDNHAADYCGAVGAGMPCYLIDPEARHDIPAGRRLRNVLDLPQALRSLMARHAR